MKNGKDLRRRKSLPVTALSGKRAQDYFLQSDQYCPMELPEYFDFGGVLKYIRETVDEQSLDDCLAEGLSPAEMEGVDLDILTNKDGRYGVRPLTIANPILYYLLVRDICEEGAWQHVQSCFRKFRDSHISACSIPVVKIDKRPEAFHGATTILNWWNSMEQASIELSLKYRYMFLSDITNCFGQIDPDYIAKALSVVAATEDPAAGLASRMQRYLRGMQGGRNVGIPQGGTLFNFIAEMVLGYADLLLGQAISNAQADGDLPRKLDYRVLRYVDDYRIFCNDREALYKISYILQHVLEGMGFRMSTSKTRISEELITDSIKPDKAFYVFNTPIESKQSYRDLEGRYIRRDRGYDFDGFQKHLLFIYEFSRHFPNSGQIKTQLSSFARRIEEQQKPKTWLGKKRVTNGDTGEVKEEDIEVTLRGGLWENIPAMVAIAVAIAERNVSAAHYALKVASLLLSNMPEAQSAKKKEVIKLVYERLRHLPNSAFLQIWLQNITHTTDDWSKDAPYDMPLCRLVARQPETLWNNAWLKPEIADGLPIESIVNRETLDKTGQVITFRERRFYDELPPEFFITPGKASEESE